MKPLYRTLHPEFKIIDASKGIVDFVASDETLDYYSEIVRAAGWKFTNFAKNAPVPDSHDYSSIEKLLGKVTDWRIEGKKLIERVQFAIEIEEQPLARLAWRMIEAGYLKACSVGFTPVQGFSKYGDEKSFLNAIRELGLSTDAAAKVRTIYWEQEQMELSICILGANPAALAKAFKAGSLNDDDISLIETLSEQKAKRQTATSATNADRVDVAKGRRRASFIRNLKIRL
jgi:hypothetical protein